jgi:hypothetical protein
MGCAFSSGGGGNNSKGDDSNHPDNKKSVHEGWDSIKEKKRGNIIDKVSSIRS